MGSNRFQGMGMVTIPARAEGTLRTVVNGELAVLIYDSSCPVTVTRITRRVGNEHDSETHDRDLDIEQPPTPPWSTRPACSVRVKPPRPMGGLVTVHVRNDSDEQAVFSAGWII